MAERKSGPVKPPVIDLKARPASGPAPLADKPAARSVPAANAEASLPDETPAAAPSDDRSTEQARANPPPRPQARLAMPWSAISIAVIGGGLLGTALTYGLVNLLPLPDARAQIADPAPRLEAQDAGLAELTTRLTAVEAQSKRTQISLDATLAQLDAGLGEVRATIAALPAPSASADLSPLTAQLQSLEDRVAAIGAGASTADATTLATTLSGLETSFAALGTELAGLDQRLGLQDTALAGVQADLAATRSAIAAQNQTLGGGDIGPAVRLPLIVGGLESAFANGRPFTTELEALITLLPDLAVPDAVSATAASGLPRPDAVATRFSDIVPDILAGRTATGTGDIGQDALEWMKAVLALRPAGEREGDMPEAVVSRLEAAIDRRDFVGATALLDALPAPMQAAAGGAAADIRSLAAAETFIAGLRGQALAQATEPAP